ncbi:uncharacterized protein F4822DRAFT_429973 [Hypoxylon trugodes]|uniref:uncharacterized protein n=1 Tax=Hypoxylon trugodes TaxID=326681 RepID=UPI00219B97AE|nr:uncharacterized protein F4822DRAFT_429973 [Hypoxylon trugodes]KAI1387217.1 hypothetical protein F4822DRAFT_429973 [Hypoxylon trugodes]
MEWSLTGSLEDSAAYAESVQTPTYYNVMNGNRLDYGGSVKEIAERHGKGAEHKPVVHEFLCDGDQLAARMGGTIMVGGVDSEFENFMFAKVDKVTGRLEWLVERAIWGPIGKAPKHSVS